MLQFLTLLRDYIWLSSVFSLCIKRPVNVKEKAGSDDAFIKLPLQIEKKHFLVQPVYRIH